MLYIFFTFVAYTFSTAAAESVCEDVYPHLLLSSSQNEGVCISTGGCWDASKDVCYFPRVNGYEYTEIYKDDYELVGQLKLIESSGATVSPDFTDLSIIIQQETKKRTHIRIYPTDTDRWQIPQSVIPRPSDMVYDGSEGTADTNVFIESSAPLQFGIRRGSQLIFFMSKMLIFQDQYVQFVLASPSNVQQSYGFGESSRKVSFIEPDTLYTMWNTDNFDSNFNSSLYGSHPFYIQVLDDGSAFGVMSMTCNAQTASMYNSDTNGDSVAFQSTGGIVDLYIFAGPSPSDVIAQYHTLIGRPMIPPYFSLGFHNSRWGYPDIQYVEEVVANYSAADIPLETQWLDIDYMDNYKDFTTDKDTFSLQEMVDFVEVLHANDQFFVPIIDPGIFAGYAQKGEELYIPQTEGLEEGVFIQDLNGNPFIGWVWPGPTYFPDWFAPNTSSYWQRQIATFHKKISFDGLWIDMNEVSNFANDDGLSQVCNLTTSNDYHCYTVEPLNQLDFPPWVPTNLPYGSHLASKTIPLSAMHKAYTEGGERVHEYDAHSLYGLMESIATNEALAHVTGKRPFVLSRSSFASSGKYSAHWSGDNTAAWEDLGASLIKMSALSLFGLSMTGADVCGFNGNTTEELCGRWVQVGAFYPFMRVHNTLDGNPQELYRWDSVADIARRLIGFRYLLLPYLYTLLYNAHTMGSTVYNALWIHFPTDPVCVSSAVDGQYMWSDGLLFTPVVTQGESTVRGYFPKGVWYTLMGDMGESLMGESSAGLKDPDHDGDRRERGVEEGKEGVQGVQGEDRKVIFAKTGQWITLPTPQSTTNVHIRGGTILPLHTPTTTTTGTGLTTTALRRSPYTLMIALNETWEASGKLYIDDGEERVAWNDEEGGIGGKQGKGQGGGRDTTHYTLMSYVVRREDKDTGGLRTLQSRLLSFHYTESTSCCEFNRQVVEQVEVLDWSTPSSSPSSPSSPDITCPGTLLFNTVAAKGLKGTMYDHAMYDPKQLSRQVKASVTGRVKEGKVTFPLLHLRVPIASEFTLQWECK